VGDAPPKRLVIRGLHEMTDDEARAWAEGIENPDARRMAFAMLERFRAERDENTTQDED